jgi:hypothetical protein
MSGCLTLTLRLAAVALLVLGGFIAWSYRHEIKRQIHSWTAETAPPSAVGRAQPDLVSPARARMDSLLRARKDSVVLSAAEVASLVAAATAEVLPGAVDSLEVRLDTDDVEIRGRVDTRRIPMSLGPLGGMVREREYVEAGGRLTYRRSGIAEVEIERVRVRGLPVPKTLADQLLRRFTGSAEGGVIEVPIPRSVTGLRVSPSGVTLYGISAGTR